MDTGYFVVIGIITVSMLIWVAYIDATSPARKLIEKLEKAHSTAKSFGKNNIILGKDIENIKKTMGVLNNIIEKL